MHELPKLPYAYDSLEPYLDARTMEIHHSKHHQAYINKLNEALAKHLELENKPLEKLLADLNAVPEDIRQAVRHHGGGHFNHTLFWKIMRPAGEREAAPMGELAQAIAASFGDFEKFKEIFTQAAVGQFGSGWAWLVKENQQPRTNHKLKIISLPNQDSPLSQGLIPILGLDVWEHAYYLHYQNRRTDYVAAWWNVVNWEEALKNFTA